MPACLRLSTLLAAPLAVALFVTVAPAATAPLPRGDIFNFPGANPSPSSASSAGFALADRWLGDEPFNSAVGALGSGVSLSPMLQRLSRQDLRARNTKYDETRAFFDAAGGSIAYALPRSAWGVCAYATQPVFRREESAFQEGVSTEPAIPAVVRTTTKTREWRTGVAVAYRAGSWAFGVAPELVKRVDLLTVAREGANQTGLADTWDLSGSGQSVLASARYTSSRPGPHDWRIGASVRALPKLELIGTVPVTNGGGSVAATVSRESAWEGGVSLEARITPEFQLLLGAGGRTATEWTGIAASNGASGQVALAGEYHDPQLPWTFRFGVGRESNPGTHESSASQVGLGLGWQDGDLRYDFGVLHRGLQRSGAPNSSDDRVVGSVTLKMGRGR